MARRKKSSTKDAEFNRSLVSAVRSLGWLLPQTEGEVADFERVLAPSDASSPLEPLDPFEALDREPTFSKRSARSPEANAEYEVELRRAARSGTGDVSEEAEGRMRRDRRRAEQEADGD